MYTYIVGGQAFYPDDDVRSEDCNAVSMLCLYESRVYTFSNCRACMATRGAYIGGWVKNTGRRGCACGLSLRQGGFWICFTSANTRL